MCYLQAHYAESCDNYPVKCELCGCDVPRQSVSVDVLADSGIKSVTIALFSLSIGGESQAQAVRKGPVPLWSAGKSMLD